jgi:DNA-binding CsgD family transcriptional regulator
VNSPLFGTRLTPRELEVLRLVALGLKDGEIGQRLWIVEDTVGSHLRRIRARLGESARAGVVRAAFEAGYLRLPDEVVLRQAEAILQRDRLAKVRADVERQARGRAA